MGFDFKTATYTGGFLVVLLNLAVCSLALFSDDISDWHKILLVAPDAFFNGLLFLSLFFVKLVHVEITEGGELLNKEF